MGQFDVVEFINISGMGYTCKELAKVFNVTPSSMSRLLTICYKYGYISRKPLSHTFPITFNYFKKI